MTSLFVVEVINFVPTVRRCSLKKHWTKSRLREVTTWNVWGSNFHLILLTTFFFAQRIWWGDSKDLPNLVNVVDGQFCLVGSKKRNWLWNYILEMSRLKEFYHQIFVALPQFWVGPFLWPWTFWKSLDCSWWLEGSWDGMSAMVRDINGQLQHATSILESSWVVMTCPC